MEKISSRNTISICISGRKLRQVIRIGTKAGNHLYHVCLYCHFYCVPWSFRAFCFCHYAACERNWCTKSTRRKRKQHCKIAVERFFKTRYSRFPSCISCCMVRHAQLVKRFCLPYRYSMVGICTSCNCCDACSAYYS